MPGERGGAGAAEGAMTPLARLSVLGPTRVEAPGLDARLRPRERAVLAAIALDHPEPVGPARIVELVWGDAAPATARKSVHNHVARLRQAVPGLLESVGRGYRLAEGTVLDLDELAEAVRHDDEGVRPPGLEPLVGPQGGEPFADLDDHPDVVRRRRQVARLELEALALHARQLLDGGAADAAEAAEVARTLVERDPRSERHWWLLAVALARTGRRREALELIGVVRSELVERGVDLGPDLARLERLIIAADPVVHTGAILSAPDTAAVGDGRGTGPVGLTSLIEHVTPWMGGDGPPALLLVGPAGSGKTTASHEIARLARSAGLAVVTSGCDPEPSLPLHPLVSLLEGIGHRHPTALEVEGAGALGALSEVLAKLVGGARPSNDPHTLLDVVDRVVARLSTPLLLVVEDLHWAPPLTLEAVRRLSTAARAPVRVLVTSRPGLVELGHEPAVSVCPLPPWAPGDVAAWLREWEPDVDRRTAAAAWLHQQTGGLPIYVRELTLALLDDGCLGPESAGAFTPPTTVPPAVAAALAARVERCSPGARRTLEMAAVLGPRFPAAWLRAMLGVTAPSLSELRAAGLLQRIPGTRSDLAFEHELLRRAALDRLTPAAAIEVHHLALAALDEAGLAVPAAVRARHAVAAAAVDLDRAVTAAEAAGQAAVVAGSHREGADWLLQAAQIEERRSEPDPARRADLTIAAGQALLHAGDERAPAMLYDAAQEAEARGDWDTAARAAVALCRLGPTSAAGTVDHLAATLSDRLLAEVEDPARRAALAAAATMVHSMAGAHERCRALFDAAERDARTAGTDDALVDVLPFAYMSLSAPEDLDRRVRITDRLAAAADRLDSPSGRWSALHLRFSNQLQAGDPGLRATAAALMELTPEVGERQREWEEHYVRAALAHLDDRLEEAEAIITASLVYADTVAESRVMAVYGAHLLGIRLAQGRLAELVDAVAELAAGQPEVGAWQAALALAAAHAGRTEQAERAFDALADRPEALARDYAFTGAALALGEAAVALADPERAHVASRLLDPIAGRWSWVGTCTLGPVDATRAALLRLLGAHEEADRAAVEARRSCRALAAPGFEALAAGRGGRRAAS